MNACQRLPCACIRASESSSSGSGSAPTLGSWGRTPRDTLRASSFSTNRARSGFRRFEEQSMESRSTHPGTRLSAPPPVLLVAACGGGDGGGKGDEEAEGHLGQCEVGPVVVDDQAGDADAFPVNDERRLADRGSESFAALQDGPLAEPVTGRRGSSRPRARGDQRVRRWRRRGGPRAVLVRIQCRSPGRGSSGRPG